MAEGYAVRAEAELGPLLAVLVAALVFGVACSSEEHGSAAGSRDRPLPDQVLSDFEITETSRGSKDWTMKADNAYVYEDRNVLEAEVVEVVFYDQGGTVRSVLKAERGMLNRATDDMEAKGNVVVTGSDGVTLETQSLKWESSTRQITSEDSVRVVRGRDVLTGWGFRGDPDLGSFRILRNMRATIITGSKESEGLEEHGADTEDGRPD